MLFNSRKNYTVTATDVDNCLPAYITAKHAAIMLPS